ncbi:MAG: DUF1254 domain-containing protein [Deltaproteobacteria bacterium]|nr:DUF1254 domain-containing protein [Deltaproteobacteria bacterium]
MKINFQYVIGTLIIALIVCAYGIYTMPQRLVAERNKIYVQQANGHNRFVHKSLPDASWKEFVRPCPDLLYSYLVFDTRQSAIAVEMPGYDDYWVNQMVDDQTDSFAYVGQRSAGNQGVKFVLYSDQTPPFKTPEGFLSFKSPSPTGTFLLRYLVRSPDSVRRIEELRKQIQVKVFGKT